MRSLWIDVCFRPGLRCVHLSKWLTRRNGRRFLLTYLSSLFDGSQETLRRVVEISDSGTENRQKVCVSRAIWVNNATDTIARSASIFFFSRLTCTSSIQQVVAGKRRPYLSCRLSWTVRRTRDQAKLNLMGPHGQSRYCWHADGIFTQAILRALPAVPILLKCVLVQTTQVKRLATEMPVWMTPVKANNWWPCRWNGLLWPSLSFKYTSITKKILV